MIRVPVAKLERNGPFRPAYIVVHCQKPLQRILGPYSMLYISTILALCDCSQLMYIGVSRFHNNVRQLVTNDCRWRIMGGSRSATHRFFVRNEFSPDQPFTCWKDDVEILILCLRFTGGLKHCFQLE